MIWHWSKDDVATTLLGMMQMPRLLRGLATVDANTRSHPLIFGGLEKNFHFEFQAAIGLSPPLIHQHFA
jgi:hypothetical protein